MGHVFKTLAERTIADAPAYFAARLVIEDCENIHLHYRNLRFEFSAGEFIQLVDAMVEAKQKLLPPPLQDLPLSEVDPWDEAHIPTDDEYMFYAEPQDLHLARIDEVKRAIEQGKRIRPILVTPTGEDMYKRKDGFCRYMAHKILNLDTIECIVLQDAPAGGQDQMSCTVSPEEYELIKQGKSF